MARLDPTGVSRILSYIKNWVTTALSGKANSSHSHTKSQITDFPTIPSSTSQLTNDSGYITSSGSCNYANSAGGVAWDNVSGKPSTFAPHFTNGTWYAVGDDAAIGDHNVGGGLGVKALNSTTTRIDFCYKDDASNYKSITYDGTTLYLNGNCDYATSAGSCNYANSTGYVQGNNNSANAANALLRSGSGRADSSPEGDTWIFLDELGGSSAPWGFKHNQEANTIGFYGAGTETSSINLSNGYFSGSCNYANSSGNADTLDGYHHDSFPKTSAALFTVNGLGTPGWSKIGTGEGGSCIQVKTTDNTYPSICFHRSGHSHCVLAESGGQLGTMQQGGSFNHLITSANIGSQSVNYATSAGSAGSVAWDNVSGKPSAFTPYFANGTWYAVGDDAAIGDHNVGGGLGVKALNSTTTRIDFCYKDDASNYKSITYDGTTLYLNGNCDYANSAGNSDTLDGYHEYSFLRNRGATSVSGEGTLWTQIGIKEYYNVLPDGLSGVYNYGEVVSLPGANVRFDIYCSHQSSDGNGLYYRSGWGDDKKAWRRINDEDNTYLNGYRIYVD